MRYLRQFTFTGHVSTKSRTYSTSSTIRILNKTYPTDSWTNIPPNILSKISKHLHLNPSHPLHITRSIIEQSFPSSLYTTYNTLSPIVTVHQNFDSLGFPKDHVGRSTKDTYYVNRDTLLRTHTSAHQADTFRDGLTEGYLISADVFRRDAIDKSHYPIFHQMEGARMWDRDQYGSVAAAIMKELEGMPKPKEGEVEIVDESPPFHKGNPIQDQDGHTEEDVTAIVQHLKRSLEIVVVDILTRARAAAQSSSSSTTTDTKEPIQIRWVDSYFPFTTPSWEMEVSWQGTWLEILGCGVVRQHLPRNAGVPSKIGWAFGLGIERIAMLLFGIPDIRLFWSNDERFFKQFTGGANDIQRYVPFSIHPPVERDVSFWLPESTTTATSEQLHVEANPGSSIAGAAGGSAKDGGPTAEYGAAIAEMTPFHENDLMEIIRDVAGDIVEDVKLMDEFTHPKTKKRSLTYRITYRSLHETLKNEEVNKLQSVVEGKMREKFGITLR